MRLTLYNKLNIQYIALMVSFWVVLLLVPIIRRELALPPGDGWIVPIVVFAVFAPVILVVDLRVRRAHAAKGCRYCGYDTRGLDRCPECGE